MSEFEFEDQGDGRFKLCGEMSFDTADRILKATDALFGQYAALEIDLAGVERADSAGLALLLEWKAQARQRAASIRFSGIPDSLRAIARTTEVDDLL